jgi:hypothetical protein
MPVQVLDCPAYAGLDHSATRLLWDIARLYLGDNNGRLLCPTSYFESRGWKSRETITRCLRTLEDAGFIFRTAVGTKPRKAALYAITWQPLDKSNEYDAGVEAAFQKAAYLLEK